MCTHLKRKSWDARYLCKEKLALARVMWINTWTLMEPHLVKQKCSLKDHCEDVGNVEVILWRDDTKGGAQLIRLILDSLLGRIPAGFQSTQGVYLSSVLQILVDLAPEIFQLFPPYLYPISPSPFHFGKGLKRNCPPDATPPKCNTPCPLKIELPTKKRGHTDSHSFCL